MWTANFYARHFDSRGNSIGKKLIRLDWEKAVYRPLFTLANSLDKVKSFTENDNQEVWSDSKLLFWFAKDQHWVEII